MKNNQVFINSLYVLNQEIGTKINVSKTERIIANWNESNYGTYTESMKINEVELKTSNATVY